MAVIRRLVSQDQGDCQPLRVDHSSRYIVNSEDHWQFLFNLDSELTRSVNVVKAAAQLNTSSLNSIEFIGYLWDNVKNSINQAASCTFKIYRVDNSWVETLVHTVSGIEQPSSYFLATVDFSNITGANLDGETTLMVEVELVRLGRRFREKIYVNHLGIYDSFLRLKQEVEYLDLVKLDE